MGNKQCSQFRFAEKYPIFYKYTDFPVALKTMHENKKIFYYIVSCFMRLISNLFNIIRTLDMLVFPCVKCRIIKIKNRYHPFKEF